jgi:hypothetical protein
VTSALTAADIFSFSSVFFAVNFKDAIRKPPYVTLSI